MLKQFTVKVLGEFDDDDDDPIHELSFREGEFELDVVVRVLEGMELVPNHGKIVIEMHDWEETR